MNSHLVVPTPPPQIFESEKLKLKLKKKTKQNKIIEEALGIMHKIYRLYRIYMHIHISN